MWKFITKIGLFVKIIEVFRYSSTTEGRYILERSTPYHDITAQDVEGKRWGGEHIIIRNCSIDYVRHIQLKTLHFIKKEFSLNIILIL